MYKFFIIALVGGFLHNNVEGQQAVSVLVENTTNKTLLWQVSGNGLKEPSYFLGTMHILCPEDAYLSDAVMAILDKVDEIYFEIDLDNMPLMLTAMRSMTMRNDTLLSDLLPENDYKELETYFSGKLPLPFGMLKRMKPMLLASMMSEQMLPCKAGSGTEMLISEEAGKRKMATKGLETPSYQFGLFDSIPYVYQAQELLKAVREDGAGTEKQTDGVTLKMLKAFQEQDLEALELLTKSEEGGVSAYLDLLVYNRNRNWANDFEEIAAKGSFLFAVGAGHLPGEDGVLNLLKKKGFTLTPLLNGKPK
jgi:uncharacterized protein YbaP (TraB family)